jgi:ribosomal protein S6
MTRTYEGLFILNTAGKEESGKELVEKIEKEIQTNGGKPLKVERMDKRPFARVAHAIDSGYYVNIVFDMESDKLQAFRSKLKLSEDVFRVLFLNSKPAPKKKTKAAAATA